MKSAMKTIGLSVPVFLACAAILVLPMSAQAVGVDWDWVIFESGADASVYDATIDMSLIDPDTLEIVLTNTSTGDAGGANDNLLTGLGFDLPGLFILGGDVEVSPGSDGAYKDLGGNTQTLSAGQDVSGEYGYMNTVDSGQFHTVLPGEVDVVVSAMEASSDYLFSMNALGKPLGLNGPEFGLLSSSLIPSDAGGLNYIQDSITYTLDLGGFTNGGWDEESLIQYINDGDVVIAFGSPDAVPEPSTLLLLGGGLVGLATFRKRFSRS